jgi:hypothetical protein
LVVASASPQSFTWGRYLLVCSSTAYTFESWKVPVWCVCVQPPDLAGRGKLLLSPFLYRRRRRRGVLQPCWRRTPCRQGEGHTVGSEIMMQGAFERARKRGACRCAVALAHPAAAEVLPGGGGLQYPCLHSVTQRKEARPWSARPLGFFLSAKLDAAQGPHLRTPKPGFNPGFTPRICYIIRGVKPWVKPGVWRPEMWAQGVSHFNASSGSILQILQIRYCKCTVPNAFLKSEQFQA